MSIDSYSVRIVRTGRIWRRVTLIGSTVGMWPTFECGGWFVPGERWALSKARRAIHSAERKLGYAEGGNS